MNAQHLSARVLVQTGGVWRLPQLTAALNAIDGLSSRIAVAQHIAESCEEMNYVISNLRALGLLAKGKPDQWGETKYPTDLVGRKDYIEFVSLMCNAGVEVQLTDLGVKLSFAVSDLIDLVPSVNRPEIDRINMSSPGEWSIVLTDFLGSKEWVRLLERIFDALFYNRDTGKRKKAEARKAIAKARQEEAKAKHMEIDSELQGLTVASKRNDLILDYSVAVDSLVASLRNAGFADQEIRGILKEKLLQDIDTLSRFKSLGLIKSATVQMIETR